MLFNSFTFAIFFPTVFLLYWFIFNRTNVKIRNLFLLIASYTFYGWWDWRFLILIAITSLCSWVSGYYIHKAQNKSDLSSDFFFGGGVFLALNIVVNLVILAVFKYYNFFIDSVVETLKFVGLGHTFIGSLDLILPVGISFYTFQALSYSIDVYRKEMEPTKDIVQFFAFVSFFPQLVAGPIERAKNLLPQFNTLKQPDYEQFRTAMLQIAWGFFQKLMVADRLAIYVENTFDKGASDFPMLLGAIFFAMQLYLDFAAYSNIAIGCARMLGFDLMTNFRRPYLSTSFKNFWKRWHISLSSWFMDYLYIPLGGNRKGRARKNMNLLIVFAVSGLWHGASWNFVIWGIANGLFLILLDPVLNIVKSENIVVRAIKSFLIVTCWSISLIFFRAKGFDTALQCLTSLSFSNAADIVNHGLNTLELQLLAIVFALLLIKDLVWEKYETTLPTVFFEKTPTLVRWGLYITFILSIIYLGQYGGGNDSSFIYFQF